MKNENHIKGFSLIELMVIISILGIIASIAIPAYKQHITQTKISADAATCKVIFDAAKIVEAQLKGTAIDEDKVYNLINGGVEPNSAQTGTQNFEIFYTDATKTGVAYVACGVLARFPE